MSVYVGEVRIAGMSSGIFKNAKIAASGGGVEVDDGNPSHEFLLIEPVAARALAALLVVASEAVEGMRKDGAT